MTEEYDVVLNVLQQRRDELWKMTDINMRANMFNVRLEDWRIE